VAAKVAEEEKDKSITCTERDSAPLINQSRSTNYKY